MHFEKTTATPVGATAPGTGNTLAPTVERRAARRIPCDALVTWASAEIPPQTARMRDLSPRGLCFATSHAPAVGTVLEICGQTLRARAMVRTIRDGDDGQVLVGVEFDSVRFHDPHGLFAGRVG